MELTDKQITCADCSKPFVFTASEQRWYRERGFEREPKRCQDCRKSRKGRGEGSGGGGRRDHSRGGQGHAHAARGGQGGEQGSRGGRQQRFSVTCSQCGASAEVPFQPRPGAPVYCSTCYKARRA